MTATQISFTDECTLRVVYYAGKGQAAEEWVPSGRLVQPDVSRLAEAGLLEHRQADDGGDEYRITPAGVTAIADSLTHDRVIQIAARVAEATHQRMGWVARQQNKDNAYTGWAFVVGNACPFLSNEALVTRTDDDLFAQVFTEMMGYAPGSAADLQAQIDRNLARREERAMQLNDLEEEIALLDGYIDHLRQQLAERETDGAG